jgi:DNA-binding NarL/FixJ family response regulator
MNDSIGIGGNYNNLGLVMEKLGQLPEALFYYLRSLQISQQLGYSIGISNTCANAGKIYSEMNKPDSALYFVNMGIDEAIRSGDKTFLLKNYETLYQIYEKLGKNSEALEAYKNYVSIKDSIFNTEKSRQIAEMEAKYETEKKEKENRILRQNIVIQKRTSLLLIVSLAAFIVVAVLLFYFYRLRNKALKQKTILYEQQRKLQELEKSRLEDQLFAEQQINKLQNEKLEQQNRELSSRILHAINKNEAMNNILEELKKNKDNKNIDYNQCYLRVNQLVKENISIDKEWDQFKLHFEEVNPGFFNSLQEKYPELTQNELKLCAYYRINLNTKEIAKMLNVTNAAIQKSRYRLRKKMDIPSEMELPEFMGRF